MKENKGSENYHDDEFLVLGQHLYRFNEIARLYNNEGGDVEGIETGRYKFDVHLDGDLANYLAEAMV